MSRDYQLEFPVPASSSACLSTSAAELVELRRMVLEPELVNLCSRVCARALGGVHQSQESHGMSNAAQHRPDVQSRLDTFRSRAGEQYQMHRAATCCSHVHHSCLCDWDLALAGLGLERMDLAVKLDENYDMRNSESFTATAVFLCGPCRRPMHCKRAAHMLVRSEWSHSNSDEALASTAQKLLRAGAVALFKEEMPVQCAVLEHYRALLE